MSLLGIKQVDTSLSYVEQLVIRCESYCFRKDWGEFTQTYRLILGEITRIRDLEAYTPEYDDFVVNEMLRRLNRCQSAYYADCGASAEGNAKMSTLESEVNKFRSTLESEVNKFRVKQFCFHLSSALRNTRALKRMSGLTLFNIGHDLGSAHTLAGHLPPELRARAYELTRAVDEALTLRLFDIGQP